MIIIFCVFYLCLGLSSSFPPCPQSCSCYNRYRTMDCRESSLFTVPEVNNLTSQLYLDDNQIRHLPHEAFVAAPYLGLISIQNNFLSILDTRTFRGLTTLHDLDVSGNWISFVRCDLSSRSSAHNLTSINMAYNKLQQVPESLPHFAPQLRILNLAYNVISSAYFDSSYGMLKSLQSIDLSGNVLTELRSSHLAALRNTTLTTFNLISCGLVEIDSEVLTGFYYLKHLYLSENAIPLAKLEAVLYNLSAPESLVTLDLSDNFLQQVNSELFSRFENLHSLSIANCTVSEIDSVIFTKLTQLQALHLQNNDLLHVENITYLTSLTRLNLKNNLLSAINITGLSRIQYIDLRNNNINLLPYRWLIYAEEIQLIDLSHNTLRYIDKESFYSVSVQLLNISYNSLQTLQSFGSLKVIRLDVSHNNIDSISHDALQFTARTLEELDLSYNRLQTLPRVPLTPNIAMENINLSYNNLSTALYSNTAKMFFRSISRVQILDLSYNNITSISIMNFMYLEHLTTLYLRGNHIYDPHILGINNLFSIAKLDLSDNVMRTLNPNLFASFTYLESVDISDNPYECDCSNKQLLLWLNSTSINVLSLSDPSKYHCTHVLHNSGAVEHVYIMDFLKFISECDHHNSSFSWDVTAFGITVGVVVVVVLVIAVIIYQTYVCHCIKRCHYRWQIRYREVSEIAFTDQPI